MFIEGHIPQTFAMVFVVLLFAKAKLKRSELLHLRVRQLSARQPGQLRP